MNRADTILTITNNSSLTSGDLTSLTDYQLNEIEATDINWCESSEDISMALVATYEQTTEGE